MTPQQFFCPTCDTEIPFSAPVLKQPSGDYTHLFVAPKDCDACPESSRVRVHVVHPIVVKECA